MAVPQGLLGGISVKPEVTYGVDPGTTGWTFLPSRAGTNLAKRRSYFGPQTSGISMPTVVEVGPSWVDGEIQAYWSFTHAVVSPVMANFMTVAGAGPYSYVATTAPSTNSIAISKNIGGTEYVLTGCKGTSMRWELDPADGIKWNIGYIGQDEAVHAAQTVANPADSVIAMPSDLTACTLGGTALGIKSAVIELTSPYTGSDRSAYGGTTLREPFPSGKRAVTVGLNLEVDDSTGFNSIAEYADYLSGTANGDLVITFGTSNYFSVLACQAVGDGIAHQFGIQDFNLSLVGTSLLVMCAA